MNVVGAVRHIIISDSDVTGLLATNESVFPVVIPQAGNYPAVTVKIGDDRQNNCKGATTDMDVVEVLVGIFSKTYDKSQRVDTAIRNAIDGFNGAVTTSPDNVVHFFEDISFLYRNDDYDEENKLFYRTVSYKCRYKRTVPAVPIGQTWAELVASLPVYESDEQASAAGLQPGDVYLSSADHQDVRGGIMIQLQ
jgi:hypothetical protein